MNFDKLCNKCYLGNVINIEKLTGGLMHKMFKVETESGVYAIKVLNPEVMNRPTALNNFVISEKISNLAKDNKISVSSARMYGENFLIRFEENYYMIFDFIEGKILNDDEIKIIHCEKIGYILGQIHNLDYRKLGLDEAIKKDTYSIDWQKLYKLAKQKNIGYLSLLEDNINRYDSLFINSLKSFNDNNNIIAISHKDMNPKNVMWENDNPIIIDWESASLSNPYRELVEDALCWSGFLSNDFDKAKFIYFVKSYKSIRGIENINWNGIICGNLIGRLGWLEYNMKRSLGIKSSDKEEMLLAEKEVIKTIDEIKRYVEISPIIEEILKNIAADK